MWKKVVYNPFKEEMFTQKKEKIVCNRACDTSEWMQYYLPTLGFRMRSISVFLVCKIDEYSWEHELIMTVIVICVTSFLLSLISLCSCEFKLRNLSVTYTCSVNFSTRSSQIYQADGFFAGPRVSTGISCLVRIYITKLAWAQLGILYAQGIQRLFSLY